MAMFLSAMTEGVRRRHRRGVLRAKDKRSGGTLSELDRRIIDLRCSQR